MMDNEIMAKMPLRWLVKKQAIHLQSKMPTWMCYLTYKHRRTRTFLEKGGDLSIWRTTGLGCCWLAEATDKESPSWGMLGKLRALLGRWSWERGGGKRMSLNFSFTMSTLQLGAFCLFAYNWVPLLLCFLLFCVYVSVLECSLIFFFIFHIWLKSHGICLSLTYFTKHNTLKVQPYCHKWQDFIFSFFLFFF